MGKPYTGDHRYDGDLLHLPADDADQAATAAEAADQAATAAEAADQADDDSGELRPSPATDLFPYTWRELDAHCIVGVSRMDDPCRIIYDDVTFAVAFGRVNAHRICTGLNLAHIAGRMVA